MANTVKHKRSNVAATVPTAAQVDVGELAINFVDKKIYTQEPGGTIIELGGGGSGSKWTDTGSDIYRNSKVRVGGTSAPVAALDVTGDAAISTDLSVNGNTTLGDAAADTITANASTLAIPNDLNIDSNTMFIDAANDRVAIGAATAGAKLDVQANTTAPAVRITQQGTGAALLIEDAASTDTSPFIINDSGQVGIGLTAPATNSKVDISGTAAQNIVATTGDMDLAQGQVFTNTVSAATTFRFINPPASRSTTAVLHLTNGGAAAVTWNAAIKWPSATSPTLTAAGLDVLVFHTVDGGTTWRGNIFGKDVK